MEPRQWAIALVRKCHHLSSSYFYSTLESSTWNLIKARRAIIRPLRILFKNTASTRALCTWPVCPVPTKLAPLTTAPHDSCSPACSPPITNTCTGHSIWSMRPNRRVDHTTLQQLGPPKVDVSHTKSLHADPHLDDLMILPRVLATLLQIPSIWSEKLIIFELK